ncbi:MAG: hypothetical protein M1820_007421 [Bogoriella megaspora]|nr:MAG: hypothetical protein M1820_007421 [Bogoriella megaspora]
MALSKVADNGLYFAGKKANPFAVSFLDLARELRDQIYGYLISLKPYSTEARPISVRLYQVSKALFCVSRTVREEFIETLCAQDGGAYVYRSLVDSAKDTNAYYNNRDKMQATIAEASQPSFPHIPIKSFHFVRYLDVGFDVRRGRFRQLKSDFAVLRDDKLCVVDLLTDALKDSPHIKSLTLRGCIRLPVDVFWTLNRLSPLVKIPAFCLVEFTNDGARSWNLFKTTQFSWIVVEIPFKSSVYYGHKSAPTPKRASLNDISDEHTLEDCSDRNSVAQWCRILDVPLTHSPEVKDGHVEVRLDGEIGEHVRKIEPVEH